MTTSRLLALVLGACLALPTVLAESVPLTVSIVSPTPSQTVSGVLSVAAAADADGLATVTFQIDGQNVGASITAGACRVIVDTTTLADGPHTAQAIAVDTAGTSLVSAPVTFTVANALPTPTPGPQNALTITNPAPDTVVASGGVLTYTFDYVGVSSYVADVINSAGQVARSSPRTTDGTSPDSAGFTMIVGGGNNAPLPDGTYTLRLTAGTLSSSVRFIIGTATPTPTPTPSPTPTPTPTPTPVPTSPTAAEIASAVASALSGNFQSITMMLQALMIPPPTYCPVTITSVSANYANGDYRFTVRAPQGCVPPPVVGKSLQVVK